MNRSRRRTQLAALAVLAILGLLLNAASLTQYPALHTDEAWYANLASNWIATGQARTTLDAGPNPDGAGTTLLGALPMRLGIQLGGLSLAAVRVPSLIAGLLLLAAVAALGWRLWPGLAGPLAAITLALLPIFVQVSHLARPEIWVALFAVTALGCAFAGWQRRQPGAGPGAGAGAGPAWDILAALLAITAPHIHQNGVVFALALAAGYLALYGRTVFRRRGSLAFFAISLAGGAAYLYMTLGVGGSDSIVSGAGPHSIPLLSSGPLIWFQTESGRYLSFLAEHGLFGLLAALGLGLAVRRRTPPDRLLLAWLGASAAGFGLLVNRVFDPYLLPMIAVGSLLAGRLLAEWLASGEAARRGVALAALLMLALPLAEMGVSLRSATPARDAVASELQQSIPCGPSGGRVMGPNEYWFNFTACDYRSFDLVNHYHYQRGLSLAEGMAAFRPDYLIIDDSIGEKLRDDFSKGGSMMYYALPRGEYQRFLEERTALVRLISAPNAGTIQVRRVNWEVSFDAPAHAEQ